MPDEIVISADDATPAPVEPVIAEPISASELGLIAVVEPAVELASLGTPEEVSATRIDAFPSAPLSENIDSPVVEAVAEPINVAEQPVVAENPVAIETAPAIDVIAEPVVVEPVTAVEPSAPIVESPAVLQSGDLDLTPQIPVNEALTSESAPEKQPVEQPSALESIVSETTLKPAEAVTPRKNTARELLILARNSIQFRKRKKLDHIMGLFAKQVSIVNDDVEKLLHISDATASRYLGVLEKDGKIKQVGTAGRWVSYVRGDVGRI